MAVRRSTFWRGRSNQGTHPVESGVNLIIGTFGMFRNPTAREARINWTMSREDAEDLLSLVSLIHRRLDAATMPPRA